MATWQYRCVACGGVHDMSVRPAGAMLLRCTVNHEWAWHDESAFLSAAAPIRANGAGARLSGARSGAAKAASGRGRTTSRRRAVKRTAKRTAARARKGPSRKSARASSKRTKGRR